MFALLALLPDRQRKSTAVVGGDDARLFGASLLYGDGIITPGVSVLSAVEGLEVATHAIDSFVVPITLVILLGLFLVQRAAPAASGGSSGR